MDTGTHPSIEPGPRFFDRTGRRIDLARWAELSDDEDYRRVGLDAPSPAVSVSTVWLGLDHDPFGGAPQIFETLVFGGGLDGECRRYPDEDQARSGHREMVTLVRLDAGLEH